MGIKIRTLWLTPFYLIAGVVFIQLFKKNINLKKLNSSLLVDLGELSFVDVGWLEPLAKNSIPTGSETLKLGIELFCLLSGGGCGEFCCEEGLFWLFTEILSLFE